MNNKEETNLVRNLLFLTMTVVCISTATAGNFISDLFRDDPTDMERYNAIITESVRKYILTHESSTLEPIAPVNKEIPDSYPFFIETYFEHVGPAVEVKGSQDFTVKTKVAWFDKDTGYGFNIGDAGTQRYLFNCIFLLSDDHEINHYDCMIA